MGESLSKLTAPSSYYPLFVKPVTEGSSKGIDNFNKVYEPAESEQAVQRLKSKLPVQDILVESFLPGRKFTLSILGTGVYSRVVGIRESIWQNFPSCSQSRNGYTTELDYTSRKSKFCKGDDLLECNGSHDMDDTQIKAACQVALDAWNVFSCRDAGRIDIRFDSDKPDSGPNVLEVNPISGLLPDHSPFPASAARNGISELLTAIIDSSLRRTYQDVSN